MTEQLRRQLVLLDLDLYEAASATLTMEAWCLKSGLVSGPTALSVRTVTTAMSDPPESAAGVLPATEGRKYRAVELLCGKIVVARAENWYVPARLDARMNRTLDSTNIPFGRVVKPLGIWRETLERRILWRGDSRPAPAAPVLRHVAVVRRRDGVALSVVSETFLAALLGC